MNVSDLEGPDGNGRVHDRRTLRRVGTIVESSDGFVTVNNLGFHLGTFRALSVALLTLATSYEEAEK